MSKMNIVDQIEKDVHSVFTDIVSGTSYAENVITHVLKDDLPVAETVAEIIYPPADGMLKIIGLILGSLQAIGKNTSDTATIVANTVKPGTRISIEQAGAVALSAEKTYKGIEISIKKIEAELKKALAYIPKEGK